MSLENLDILAALDAKPTRGKQMCNLAKFLHDIPEDKPGRDELIRLFDTVHDPQGPVETRSGANMASVLTALGYSTTANPVIDHRNRVCRCYR